MMYELDKLMIGRGKMVLRDAGFVIDKSSFIKPYRNPLVRNGPMLIVPCAWEFGDSLFFNMDKEYATIHVDNFIHGYNINASLDSRSGLKNYVVHDWKEDKRCPYSAYRDDEETYKYHRLKGKLYWLNDSDSPISEVRDLKAEIESLEKRS